MTISIEICKFSFSRSTSTCITLQALCDYKYINVKYKPDVHNIITVYQIKTEGIEEITEVEDVIK